MNKKLVIGINDWLFYLYQHINICNSMKILLDYKKIRLINEGMGWLNIE